MFLINEEGNLYSAPAWVEKIQGLIQEGYYKKLSLIELSKEAGVHPAHLSRQFPKYFRVTLHYYVSRVKIEKATQLLREKKYALYEIAKQCGFSDPSHFNRCFRKITGLNPSAYRKMISGIV
ncbi:MAG TPA: AraC family transcriptional regulator [Bacteroidia bacterium]|jgi:AraC family transcriptional regulator|nr:AraC family transcriptional regulator [Bacteroidia bacterium]